MFADHKNLPAYTWKEDAENAEKNYGGKSKL
jgi:hypothetical protein